MLLGVFANSASSQAPPFFTSPIFRGRSWVIIPTPLPVDHLPSKCALNLHITEDLPPGPWDVLPCPALGLRNVSFDPQAQVLTQRPESVVSFVVCRVCCTWELLGPGCTFVSLRAAHVPHWCGVWPAARDNMVVGNPVPYSFAGNPRMF